MLYLVQELTTTQGHHTFLRVLHGPPLPKTNASTSPVCHRYEHGLLDSMRRQTTGACEFTATVEVRSAVLKRYMGKAEADEMWHDVSVGGGGRSDTCLKLLCGAPAFLVNRQCLVSLCERVGKTIHRLEVRLEEV